MLKTSVTQNMRWFTSVNHKLGEPSVMRKRDQGDLINCQVGRDGLSSCQVGNGKRSVEDLIYYQRDSTESSYF
jgi:hypothetical protein